MKRSAGQIPPYHSTYSKSTKKLIFPPGIRALSSVVFAEANQRQGGAFLEPCAVPATGATVRVVAYEGMAEGHELELVWQGKVNYTACMKVEKPGHYLDFIVPKQVVLDNVVPGMLGYCDVSYIVRNSDGIEISPVHRVGIADVIAANPPPVIPQAPAGEFNPHAIPEPGLRIEYLVTPDERWGALWVSYGRDGRIIALVSFNLYPEETFIDMWRIMLDQTEPGGEVRTNYIAANGDDIYCESLQAVLRVVEGKVEKG